MKLREITKRQDMLNIAKELRGRCKNFEVAVMQELVIKDDGKVGGGLWWYFVRSFKRDIRYGSGWHGELFSTQELAEQAALDRIDHIIEGDMQGCRGDDVDKVE